MKIFDCFMYFDEEIVLDLRLNTLNDFVDYFVIVESSFTHRGDKRELRFDHKKFSKFKDKIIYLVYDQEPISIEKVYEDDSEEEKSRKYIINILRCFFPRSNAWNKSTMLFHLLGYLSGIKCNGSIKICKKYNH